MILLCRYLTTWLRARRQPPLDVLDESLLPLRVLPNDLDINLHINNGRYLSLMDLGRIDLMTRTGLTALIIRNRWTPLVGAAALRFIRPLSLFARYTLNTRILAWDEKWFYLEQRFLYRGEAVAIAHVKGLIRGRQGNIAPHTLLTALGLERYSPPLPETFMTP